MSDKEILHWLSLRARFKNEMKLQYEADTEMTFEMRLTVFYDGNQIMIWLEIDI